MRAALAAVLLASAAPNARAADAVLGFNYPVWSRDGYGQAQAARSLQDLAATGAGWVALTPTLYAKDRTDSALEATAATASDDSLRAAIRAARAAGLQVALKPHVDFVGGGVRALLNPKDPKAWFAAYRARILGYARLAREEKCGLFVVGTELALLTLPQHWAAWRALIRDVRAEYPGPVTYAANWEAAEYVGFWRDLDYVGIDGYYPIAGSSPKLLRAGWEAWALEVEAVARTAGRPLLFTEIGLSSQRGAALRPWDYGDFGAADDAVQAAYLQAFLETFSGRSNFAGFLGWSWYDAPAPPGDKSMNVRGKPALDVLSSAFRAARALPPPSPPHAPAAARAATVMAGARALVP
jgi:hypothetical protein